MQVSEWSHSTPACQLEEVHSRALQCTRDSLTDEGLLPAVYIVSFGRSFCKPSPPYNSSSRYHFLPGPSPEGGDVDSAMALL